MPHDRDRKAAYIAEVKMKHIYNGGNVWRY